MRARPGPARPVNPWPTWPCGSWLAGPAMRSLGRPMTWLGLQCRCNNSAVPSTLLLFALGGAGPARRPTLRLEPACAAGSGERATWKGIYCRCLRRGGIAGEAGSAAGSPGGGIAGEPGRQGRRLTGRRIARAKVPELVVRQLFDPSG